MALAAAGISAPVARATIAELISTEDVLPPVAMVIRTSRHIAQQTLYDWHCPECGSERVAGIVGGPGLCFDCDWDGVFPRETA